MGRRNRRCALARLDRRQLDDPPRQVPPKEPRLHLKEPAITQAIAEERMGNLLAEAALEGGDDLLAARTGKRAVAPGTNEIAGLDLAVVDCRERDRVGRNGSIMSSASAGRP